MTTPSGQISLDDVNVELDISPGTQINMNAAPVRALAEVPTGAIAMSDLQGKSNAQFVTASGGTETTDGDFKIHTFNSSGTFTVNQAGNPAGSTTVDYLVVAGGGGGGQSPNNSNDQQTGGAGAGGMRFSFPNPATGGTPVSAQGYPISIGGGGRQNASNFPYGGTGGSSSALSIQE